MAIIGQVYKRSTAKVKLGIFCLIAEAVVKSNAHINTSPINHASFTPPGTN